MNNLIVTFISLILLIFLFIPGYADTTTSGTGDESPDRLANVVVNEIRHARVRIEIERIQRVHPPHMADRIEQRFRQVYDRLSPTAQDEMVQELSVEKCLLRVLIVRHFSQVTPQPENYGSIRSSALNQCQAYLFPRWRARLYPMQLDDFSQITCDDRNNFLNYYRNNQSSQTMAPETIEWINKFFDPPAGIQRVICPR